MSDLDVLVPAERIDECAACLREQGYQPLTEYRHPKEHHYPLLGRAGSPLPVELHYKVLAYPHSELLTADEVRQTAVPLTGHACQIAVPSATHAIIHNVAHAQLSNHDYLYGLFDLRSLFDFALFCRVYPHNIDWDEVNRRLGPRQGEVALNYHILCAQTLLHAQIVAIAALKRSGPLSRWLFRRSLYLVSWPRLRNLGARIVRPWLLFRREISDAALRRRLARNLTDRTWWKRHLKMLADRD
jgi:hypothetical protein